MYKHIELFAGCGGMTLGLKAADFDLLFANELSPMAGETFAYNLLGEDLEQLSNKNGISEKVLWIQSKYGRNELSKRLRENPFEFDNGRVSDLKSESDLNEKLLIGDIKSLVRFFEHPKNKGIVEKLKKANIDLVSGGPPCQGFSLAGKRVRDDHKNQLPAWFSDFAGLVRPKFVLLENVKGITSPFSQDNKKYFAHLEISKAFALKGYLPVCFLLNSKYFNIPQNRPRFILLGIREDIFREYSKNSSLRIETKEVLEDCDKFYKHVLKFKSDLDLVQKDKLRVYDIENFEDLKYFNGELLPQIRTTKFVTAKDALENLQSLIGEVPLKSVSNEYMNNLLRVFPQQNNVQKLTNHQYRKHSNRVKARFRVYQVLNELNGTKRDAIDVFFNDVDDELLIRKIFKQLRPKEFFIESKKELDFIHNYKEFDSFRRSLKTKKHSQRALRAEEPAPAQLTIPDDLCHYDKDELRTLTVREVARFQSFPDWFVFRSKVTTGGKQRSYEVPQYTQAGNAVPPLLAYELGITISRILENVNKEDRDVHKKESTRRREK